MLPEYDFLLKIVMVGDSFTGKSCFMERFLYDCCTESRGATIGVDFKITYRNIQRELVKVQFWDQAGQDRFRTRSNSYYRGAHWIIIMYDITNAESFARVTSMWLHEINTLYHNYSTSKIIIGNKRDLELSRVVKTEEGRKLADEIGAAFYEVSAKTGENCEECMIDILWQTMRKIRGFT